VKSGELGIAGSHLLARIEEAGLNASAPSQQRLLDGWLVRFSPGKAKRARCVNPIADGQMSLEERLRRCATVYREAGLPLLVRITPFSQPPGLDAWLESMGWARIEDTRVMVLQVLDSGAIDRSGDIHAVAAEPFAHLVGELRGFPLAQRLAHAQRLATSPVPFVGVAIKIDGATVACGQFALEDDLVGLYDIVTAPSHRRRGHAARLCAHLLATACERGARCAYLQVDAQNTSARALYRRLGFVDAYSYHYRSPDPATH
jgi:ribosomal protein S18 acetylase RimI-like enzyme